MVVVEGSCTDNCCVSLFYSEVFPNRGPFDFRVEYTEVDAERNNFDFAFWNSHGKPDLLEAMGIDDDDVSFGGGYPRNGSGQLTGAGQR